MSTSDRTRPIIHSCIAPLVGGDGCRRVRLRNQLPAGVKPVSLREVAHVEELELRRQKHLSSLERLEADAKRLQALETLLRRIINRLCLAATGRDADLNKELTRLSSAMSRKADVSELAPILVQLSSAIAQRDRRPDTSPPAAITMATSRAAAESDAELAQLEDAPTNGVAAPGHTTVNGVVGAIHAVPTSAASTVSATPAPAVATSSARIHVLLVELIDRLTALPDAQSSIESLKAQIRSAESDADFVAALQRITDMINEQHGRMQAQ